MNWYCENIRTYTEPWLNDESIFGIVFCGRSRIQGISVWNFIKLQIFFFRSFNEYEEFSSMVTHTTTISFPLLLLLKRSIMMYVYLVKDVFTKHGWSGSFWEELKKNETTKARLLFGTFRHDSILSRWVSYVHNNILLFIQETMRDSTME